MKDVAFSHTGIFKIKQDDCILLMWQTDDGMLLVLILG